MKRSGNFIEMQPPQEILIIAATEVELAPARELMEKAGDGIRIALTGPGKVSAALATLELLEEKRPDWLIQVGCAGAYATSGLATGDAAIADLEIFADEGVEAPDGFLTMKDLALPQAARGDDRLFNEVPVHGPSEAVLETIRSATGGDSRIETGRFCTVSCGSGTDAAAARIEETWNPLVESMEGAAAALVAWKQGVRFSEIRGVSNRTGHRNREEWEIPAACEIAARVLQAWVETERAGP